MCRDYILWDSIPLGKKMLLIQGSSSSSSSSSVTPSGVQGSNKISPPMLVLGQFSQQIPKVLHGFQCFNSFSTVLLHDILWSSSFSLPSGVQCSAVLVFDCGSFQSRPTCPIHLQAYCLLLLIVQMPFCLYFLSRTFLIEDLHQGCMLFIYLFGVQNHFPALGWLIS